VLETRLGFGLIGVYLHVVGLADETDWVMKETLSREFIPVRYSEQEYQSIYLCALADERTWKAGRIRFHALDEKKTSRGRRRRYSRNKRYQFVHLVSDDFPSSCRVFARFVDFAKYIGANILIHYLTRNRVLTFTDIKRVTLLARDISVACFEHREAL